MTEGIVTHSVDFQQHCWNWLREVFGEDEMELKLAQSVLERMRRFMEESLELVQSLGLPEQDVYRLVAYVYGRKPGNPAQEVGGTLVTLAVLCHSAGISMVWEGNKEITRCYDPAVMAKIRAKRVSKELHGVSYETKERPS